MAKETLYEVLGVETDASIDEIRRAFRELTRKYHPDLFRGEERKKAEARFQAITEAFNVLSRPDSRQRYDAELENGGSETLSDPKEIARRLAVKGAKAYKAGNLVDAADSLLLAVHHDDENARAHYFLGLTLVKLPGRQKEGLRHLDRAALLEPTNVAIQVEAAQAFLAAGMRARAARFAHRALELDPESSKARAVLSAVESGAQESEGNGLLGGFLRRKG